MGVAYEIRRPHLMRFAHPAACGLASRALAATRLCAGRDSALRHYSALLLAETMAAAASAVAALLALLAAKGTSPLDCACSRLYNETRGASVGETLLLERYCSSSRYELVQRCETLEQWSTWLPAIARLVPWSWEYGPPPAGDDLSCGGGGGCECGAALAALRTLTVEEEKARPLLCDIADALLEYYSAQGWTYTRWTAETLAADHLRQQKLSHSLQAARGLTRAMGLMKACVKLPNVTSGLQNLSITTLKDVSKHGRHAARLFLLAWHLSELFIPLAYERMGNLTNRQQLHGWIKNMERVRAMLDMKLMGVVHDMQFIAEQTANYKVEEDKDRPGQYKIRRPLLSDALMFYQKDFLLSRDDSGELCEQQLPRASEVFGLADALYSFYHYNLIPIFKTDIPNVNSTDEQWQLEDQSQTMVSVDTGCLQLLAGAVDRPRCPLEELPLEASRWRRQCRERLWRDVVERRPHVPVTSYLAYTERVSVNLCLLAWMAANTRGPCEDVPFSVKACVHDATCYFDSPDNQTCLQSNTTDVICSVSRAIVLLKCRDFSSSKPPKTCSVHFNATGHYSETHNITGSEMLHIFLVQPTETTLSYKETLNRVTLKYKDFRVDTLKPLEYSFIGVNIFFRLLTALVYMWLPHLGNLPGKILLSFQLTGLVQVLCSEVLYRMVGSSDLSTAVLIDSSLTLLGCLWLNSFCYQMYACVRELRLPNDLTPAETSIMFWGELDRVLIPWGIVFITCAALELYSYHYLMASRITFIVAISSSVAFNLFLLGLVAFMYHCNKKSMRRLSITGDDKGFSKKKLIFLSVNTIILSGICVIIRIGFHQAKGLAQYVYYVHIATMLQGPVLFVFLLCNGTTLPVLRNILLSLCRPDDYRLQLERCSAAERNLARRRGEPHPTAETAL